MAQQKSPGVALLNLAVGIVAAVVVWNLVSNSVQSSVNETAAAYESAVAEADASFSAEADPPEPTLADGVAYPGPVSDGEMAFMLGKIKCGLKSVGSGYSKETAIGRFCVVAVAAQNTGTEARTLDVDNVYLYDTSGRRYSSSWDASYAVNEDGAKDLNPGLSIAMSVVFDVPAGIKVGGIEVHDSMFSGGAVILAP